MKIPLTIVMIVTVVVLLGSCMPSRTATVTTTVIRSGDSLSPQLSQLQTDYEALKKRYETAVASARGQNTQSGEDLATLQAEYAGLKEAYTNLTENSGQTGLRDPGWTDLKAFVKNDDVDGTAYNLNTFACSGYAIVLRDRARKLGIRTAFIQVAFPGSAGHALNAFQTTDRGLVYIDCTEADKVAYVKVGQPYGTILIDAVLTRYIDCSEAPGDFWQPLKYIDTASPFSYDYYVDYQKRWEFYNRSVDAYNAAAAQYNAGSRQLSESQLLAWQDNFNALEKELGNTIYESPGTTGNIETYWGDNP